MNTKVRLKTFKPKSVISDFLDFLDRKNHFCDIAGCSMAFKTVYNLRDHKRIYHYHMLRYACDICGKYVQLQMSMLGFVSISTGKVMSRNGMVGTKPF